MTAVAESRPPRGRRRAAWFGILTALGIARRGFFIPYRYAGRIPGAGTREPYAAMESLFARRRGPFRAGQRRIDAYAAALERIGAEPAPAPRWSQDWFPRLDAAFAYTVLRDWRPRRVVEVGAGHSTRFLARARADGGLETRLTAIDPAPRAGLAGLPVELRRETVQEAGEAPFRDLAPGDVVMIDSSHILMPGSDVDFLFARILPRLPAGVLVQVHDVFLPDDYPPAWDWRGYNEQPTLVPLLGSGGWEVLFASHYVASRMADAIARSAVGRLPLGPGAHESSLWLRRLGRPAADHGGLTSF